MKKIAKFVLASALLAVLPLSACNKTTNEDSSIIEVVNQNFQGQGEPNENLGIDGDTYTDTLTGNKYTKTGGKWVLTRDPQALSGEGEPSKELGFDGDTYTDTISGAVYEKKDGNWVVIKEGDEVYSVTFNLNGGHFGDGSTTYPTQFVRAGRWVTEPIMEPIKAHSDFIGWYAKGSDQKWNFVGTSVYGNVELIAQYRVRSEDKIIVTIDPNNGDPKYDVETFVGDYLYPSAPSKPGYDFMGWYIEATDEKFNGNVTTYIANETLIAKWEVSTFNFKFQIEADGNATIMGILNLQSVSVSVPTTIAGHKVTRIDKGAFNSRTYIETIYIPASVEVIEAGAFRGTWRLTAINVDSANPYYTTQDGILFTKDMKELVCYPTKAGSSYTVPSGVKKIGDCAFYDSLDMGISTINLNNDLEEIGDYAFYLNETIQSIQFPRTLKKIGKSAFFGNMYTNDDDGYASPQGVMQNIGFNEGLEEIGEMAFANQYIKNVFELPSTVKSIGEYAFVNCTAITKLVINKDLETFGKNAFAGCTGILEVACNESNKNFRVNDKILYTADMKELVMCPSGRTEKVTVPNGVERLRDHAFYMVDELQEYEFPSTLKYIGDECFAQTYHLSSFTFPDSVTETGVDLFYESGISSVTFGKGLTKITSGSFDSTRISSVTIPSNIKVIEDGAFGFNSNLKNVKFSEGLEEIGDAAFYKCGISAVEFPNSLVTLGDRAFSENNIKALKVTKNLKNFGTDAFYKDSVSGTSIETIEAASDSLYYTASKNILYSKDGKTIYLAGNKVANESGQLNIPGGVEVIADYAFAGISAITELNFPSSLKEIGEGAFMKTHAKALSFGSNLKKIGEGAFYFAYTKDVTFSEGLEEIGPYAFNMADITSVTLPNSLVKVDEYAFCQTLGLKYLELGTGLKTIGDFAFGCSRIENEITIPAGVETIGEGAFTGFVSTYGSAFKNIKVDAGNTKFKSENGCLLTKDGKKLLAFSGGYGYESKDSTLYIPEGVEEIANYGIAGSRDTLIDVITIPTSLKVIGDYGFSGMMYVNVLNISANITYIGERAFEQWNGKQAINFGIDEEQAYILYHPEFLVGCSAKVKFGA